MATVNTNPAGLQAQYDARQAESAAKINDLYDKNLQTQKQALTSAYEQNLSDQQAARAGIGAQYQTAANDLAIQYERNRRNLNEQAMARGLNTGTGSQQQLALNQQWQTNYGTLRGEESAAVAEADRQITNLKNTYQNNIAQAIADNDYQKAKALLDDYNSNRSWLETQAKNLASFGDFSGYEILFGKDRANSMREYWIATNPDAAWRTGAITAERYKQMTGHYPNEKSGGSGYGGSSGLSKYHKGTWGADGRFHLTDEGKKYVATYGGGTSGGETIDAPGV